MYWRQACGGQGRSGSRAHQYVIVERQNLTMRMHMRRFTRLTNAFSKKIENHACAIALHTMFYNFVRIHQTLKITPAMAAGATMRLWEMTDIVEMIEAWEGSRAQLTLQLCPLGERLQSSVHQIHSLLDNQLEFYYQGGRLPIRGQQASPDVQNLDSRGNRCFALIKMTHHRSWKRSATHLRRG